MRIATIQYGAPAADATKPHNDSLCASTATSDGRPVAAATCHAADATKNDGAQKSETGGRERGKGRGGEGGGKEADDPGEMLHFDPARLPLDADPAVVDRCRYLVFSGAGARGAAYWGALQALVEIRRRRCGDNLLEGLRGAGGTSIGAALALIVLCYSGEDLKPIALLCQDATLWDVGAFLRKMDLERFFRTGGLCDHAVLYDRIDRLLAVLGVPPTTDFTTLHQRYTGGRAFVCNASCIDDGSTLLMSHATTPYLRVRDALCMSMCLPCVVEPFEYGGRYYVDGGYICNYIIDCFPEGEALGLFVADGQGPCDSAASCALALRTTPERGAGEKGLAAACAAAPLYLSPLPPAHVAASTAGAAERCVSSLLALAPGLSRTASMLISACNNAQAHRLAALPAAHRRNTIALYTPGFGAMLLGALPSEISRMREYGRWSVFWHFGASLFVSCLIYDGVRRCLRRARARARHTRQVATRPLVEPPAAAAPAPPRDRDRAAEEPPGAT